jgi:YggT family protein
MNLVFVAQVISLMANILILLLFVWVVLSWIMPPYHPLREVMDRIVEPMLLPIRRILPSTGPMDFSPMVLMILIVVAARILNFIILSL